MAREAYKAGLESQQRLRPSNAMGEGRFEDRRQDRSRFMAERGAPSYRQKEQAPILPGDRICPQCNFHNFKGKFGECLRPLLLILKCADP